MLMGLSLALPTFRNGASSGVDALATIGALTLPSSGARTITGATDGTYDTYWTISGGVLSRNATVGTPTAGTFTAGAKTITVEADTYDVASAAEFSAVMALGGATLSGKTIKGLRSVEMGGTSPGSEYAFPSTLSLTSPLIIGSRDVSYPAKMRRLSFSHKGTGTGAIELHDLDIADEYVSGDGPFKVMITVGAYTTGTYSTDVVFRRCDINCGTFTSADTEKPVGTAVVAGKSYIVVSIASADWTSIGGSASVNLENEFLCTSTNANISALGTVQEMPSTLSFWSAGAGLDANRKKRLTIEDCYVHHFSEGMLASLDKLTITRSKFSQFYKNVSQFYRVGGEEEWNITDNLFCGCIKGSGSKSGVHSDLNQITLAMTADDTNAINVIGNAFLDIEGTHAPQAIFYAWGNHVPLYAVKVNIKHNIFAIGQAAGITIEGPHSSSVIRWNTLIENQDPYDAGVYAPAIYASGQAGSNYMTVRECAVEDVVPTPSGNAVELNNYALPTSTDAGYAAVFAGTDFGSTAQTTLAAWRTALAPRTDGPLYQSYNPKIGWWPDYYSFGAAPANSRSGLGSGTASEPSLLVPDQVSSSWSMADAGAGDGLDVTIPAAPADGGSPITKYQYRVDDGDDTWVDSPSGTSLSFRIPASELTIGVSNTVDVRAVNAIGNGAASVQKSATPTNTYSINPVEFASGEYLQQNSGFSATGSKFMLFAANIYFPSAWPTNSDIFQMRTGAGSTRVWIRAISTGQLSVLMYDSTATLIASFTSASGSAFSADTWYTILLSLDTTAATKRWQLYRRPSGGSWSSISAQSSSITSDAVIGDCGRYSLNGSTQALYAADVWCSIGETLDLTVSGNRDKFLPTTSKGLTGATPTGTQPPIFFSGATGTWNENKGSGGGTGLVGTLSTAPSAPS